MGYDLHVTRRKDWCNEGDDITKAEFIAYVKGDPEFVHPTVNGDDHAEWKSRMAGVTYPLWWYNGMIVTKNPEPEFIDKLVAIAKALGARVQGDEGEVYPSSTDVSEPTDSAPDEIGKSLGIVAAPVSFSVVLERKFLRKSYARRLFYHPWRLVAAVVAMAFGVWWMMRDGGFGVLPWMVLGIAGLFAVVCGLAWMQRAREIDRWLEGQGGLPVVYTLSEEKIETESFVGKTALLWMAFSGLTINEEDTLLHVQGGAALTLPTRQVPTEALGFITRKVGAAGKNVEDQRRHRG